MTEFAIYAGAGGRRFVGDTDFGPVVEHLSRSSGVSVNSHARDQEAEALLHEIGLHSQAEVIRLHNEGVAGYGPANSVDTTTHCRRNDGIAYPGIAARVYLPPWGRGVDSVNTPRWCAAGRELGQLWTLTYPHSSGEAQHSNCHTAHTVARFPTLKPGDNGRAVVTLTEMLRVIHRPHHLAGQGVVYVEHRHVHYGHGVAVAVRQFQHDHHLPPDAVVGPHTWTQLRTSYHFWLNHR